MVGKNLGHYEILEPLGAGEGYTLREPLNKAGNRRHTTWQPMAAS